MVLKRFERMVSENSNLASVYYYLDLHQYRSLSNAISESLGVKHESPQLLKIKDGNVTYHSSHYRILEDFNVENGS